MAPRHRDDRASLPRAAALTLSVLVLLVAALVSAWAWFGTRGDVIPLVPSVPSAAPTGRTPDASVPGEEPPPAPAGTVTVHVTGAVVGPGVYVLPLGSRVDDALAAAGGLMAEADESAINRAQVLLDAQQVNVPVVGEAPAAAPAGGGEVAGMVNLNTASASELEELPGVGPALAGEIVAWRESRGPFASVEDLDEVPGIGPAILEKVRARVTV